MIGQVTEQLCETVQKLLDLLQTSITLDVEGTLAQILAGNPSTASVDLTVADIRSGQRRQHPERAGPEPDRRAVRHERRCRAASCWSALNLGLLNPAVDGLLGNSALNLDGLGIALDEVLSVLVNVQERFVVGSSGLAVTRRVRTSPRPRCG